MAYRNDPLAHVIDTDNPAHRDRLFPKGVRFGYDPDQVTDVGLGAMPSEIVVYSKAEMDAKLQEQQALKTSCMDFGADVPVLDQGQVGYCWAHSTTGGAMFARAMQHQKTVPLSAYAVAATIKKGKDEGGWGGLSAQFARDKGIPSQAIWPQGDRSYQKYDKAETWADAAKHKIALDYCDLTKDVYDQNLTFDQVISCLLQGIPVVVDYNFWSHSVLAVRAVKTSDGWGVEIRNSWGESWENHGNGTLTGSKAKPDGAVAIRQLNVAA